MARKITVATSAFGSLRNATREKAIEFGATLIVTAGRCGADVVCLPETCPAHDLPWEDCFAIVESIPGPLFDSLSRGARDHKTYVIAGLTERRGERIYNTAVVIDRRGELIGQYDKIHPVLPEMDRGVTPGDAVRVFETDFGRVGLAICFDIGWPAVWDELGRQGAEIVFWPSAYDGGFPLRTYAWRNSSYVVSAVSSHHARIVDRTCEVLASTSQYARLVTARLDLDKQVFHVDYNAPKLPQIVERYGNRVSIRTWGEEGIFTIEANEPGLSVDEIKREFERERFPEYHARLGGLQDERRAIATRPSPATPARDGAPAPVEAP